MDGRLLFDLVFCVLELVCFLERFVGMLMSCFAIYCPLYTLSWQYISCDGARLCQQFDLEGYLVVFVSLRISPLKRYKIALRLERRLLWKEHCRLSCVPLFR